MAIALGLFLATLATLAPPVAAVEISQPAHAPGTITVKLHFEDPDNIPLTKVLLHFQCDATGAPGFTDEHDLVDGDDTLYATLHISPLSNASGGYGYVQGTQTGYGFHGGAHGYATGDTSLASGYGYGYGYGYTDGDLVLLIDLHAGAFVANEFCTLVVGIDAPGLAGDFESPRSEPFQPRIPPVADANPGPDNVIPTPEGANVTLDGSESNDPDGLPDPLAYDWVQADGSPVVLSPGPEPWLTNFTAPSNGDENLTFTLTVDDGLDGNSSQVIVRVHHDNLGPLADAGADQSAPEGATVTLDGSASSDPEGDGLDFRWAQVSGPAVTLTGADTDQPTFTVPDLAGGDQDATFRLNVTDRSPLFDLDEVTVHLQKRPIATLEVLPAELEGRAPHTVHFSVNATCFAPGCSPSLFFTDGQSTTAITTGSTQTVTHEYAENGTYEPFLHVVDGRGLERFSLPLAITVLPAGTPYANAGPDQSVYETEDVTLDGRASYDTDGNITAYAWTQVGGDEATLSGASTARPTFTASSAGTLTFTLTVTDDDGLHDADDVTVTVHPTPTGGLFETYFLHAPGCLVGGQALEVGGVPPLADRDAHASHDRDGTGNPALVGDDGVELDHVCLQPADGAASALPDPLAILDGQDDFPSEDDDGTHYAYTQGSRVDGTLGLSLLLPPSLGDAPVGDDATLDVFLLDGSDHVLGQRTGIHVDYDDLAFGLPANLVAMTPEAHYKAVPFHFVLNNGGLASDSSLTLSVQVHSELVNVFLEDGHESSFTLTQANPQRNSAPEASIDGPETVFAGDDVVLTSDVQDDEAPDLDAIAYTWYQVGGPHVDLADVHSSELSFEAPAVDENTTFTFALQASTGIGASRLTSEPAEVPVVVALATGGEGGGEDDVNNTAPIAFAGPSRVVDEGAAVVLDGVAVDLDEEAVTADWSQLSGPAVTLTQLPGSDASFTAPQVNGDKQLTFRITATDARGASSTDTTVVTVRDRSGSSTTTTTGSGGSGGSGGSDGSGGNGGSGSGGSDGSGGNGGSGSGGSGSGGNGGSTTNGPALPGSSGSSTFPPPIGGVLGYDLSATLRVTRVGNVNHLEWDSPGFVPLGYQLWSSNSPYVLLAINDGDQTTYDDATGTQDTVYKVTYFTGMTEAQGFFGDAAKVFDWPEAQHHAKRSSHIPGLDAGLVALGLLGAAMAVAVRRR